MDISLCVYVCLCIQSSHMGWASQIEWSEFVYATQINVWGYKPGDLI